MTDNEGLLPPFAPDCPILFDADNLVFLMQISPDHRRVSRSMDDALFDSSDRIVVACVQIVYWENECRRLEPIDTAAKEKKIGQALYNKEAWRKWGGLTNGSL